MAIMLYVIPKYCLEKKLFLHCVIQAKLEIQDGGLHSWIQLASHMIQNSFFAFLDLENMGIVVRIAQLYCIQPGI